jgi:[CysO sulfur-carrier protein]-S-L-cysteine hydrolase
MAVSDVASLRLARSAHAAMLAHALDGLPHEACGLLVGPAGGDDVVRFVPCENAAKSAKVYTISESELDAVAEAAFADGFDVLGTMHSHTHTEAYPSPTDQTMALPWWTYVIVSLRLDAPTLRAYRMSGDDVAELPVVLVGD